MNYTTAFSKVDQLLTQWQSLIHFRPFHDTSIPDGLEPEQQQLVSAFTDLNENQLDSLEHSNGRLLQAVRLSAPRFAEQLEQLQDFENTLEQTLGETNPLKVDRFFNVGIPGRKWQQIQNFARAMPSIANPIIDWCSGKGHLARLLHHRHQQPVTCLEYDVQLCRDGEALVQQQQLPIDFMEQDVLQPLPATLNTAHAHYTALHACGDLHLAFLKNAVQTPISGLSLSPCCYQKTQQEHYQPLSRSAQVSSLHLSRQDLALAVAETVTGGARVARLRHQERLWRVAFDIHQKHLSGEKRALTLPSFPKRLLSQTFTEFCQWAISIKQLELAVPEQEEWLLQEAEQKLLTIRQLELLQQPLKRPLELWLILDRVLYLEEHGFECQLSLFCERAISPRNFLIQAQAPQSSETK